MTHAARLLAGTAGAVLTLALTAAPLTAAADVTVSPTLPTTLPTDSVSVPVPTVTVPLPPAELPPAPSAAPTQTAGAAAAGPAPSGPPRVSLPPAPTLPELPALPGSGGETSPPPENGPDDGGGTSESGPVGDDVLPAALEAELCTLLTKVLGPLPEQVEGLPSTVIDELPAQVTDLVPADVLATVTLHCPAAEPSSPAAAPAEVRSVSTKRVAQASERSAPRRAGRAGLAALPHTGLVVGLPLAGAALLLLSGLAVRRAGRAHRRAS